jgi:heme oxygenase (biliverdin-IX-beta and delta-forming)
MLLARLKRETSHLHQRLEDGLDLFRSDFSLEDYRFLLGRFYGYYLPWEACASAVAPRLVSEREKRARLESDLLFLGLNASDLAGLARCLRLPPLDTLERVLGSMYVLEGATLGGRILERRVRSLFQLSEGGCAFFSGYGERTAAMWKEFGLILENCPKASHEELVASAIATFETMGRWLGVFQLGVSAA